METAMTSNNSKPGLERPTSGSRDYTMGTALWNIFALVVALLSESVTGTSVTSRVRRGINEKHCGFRPLGTRIIGGGIATPHSWPWMVGIFKVNPHRFLCGGSIINKVSVVTAAHCLVTQFGNRQNYSIFVRVGAHDIDNSGTNYQVDKVIIPKGYRYGSHYYDIGLILLSKPVEYNYKVQPICIPELNQPHVNLDNNKVVVIGWGDTERTTEKRNVLRELELPVVTNEQCNKSYQTLPFSNLNRGITDDMICAGYQEGGKDSCQGDSGGPLMYHDSTTGRMNLIGVVSFGFDCALPNIPGVYTRLSSYVNWLRKIAFGHLIASFFEVVPIFQPE
ncbi:clotting factor G beta subunit-like isoform X2 [Tachypleus tridentatus]|uniref:clotting factor G beta subunit-like isoform X2 n=1 Tax=Tachypleus tridentatus TaxID=6853 RepID=UPI003FD61C1D